jgi:hypothetical protein
MKNWEQEEDSFVAVVNTIISYRRHKNGDYITRVTFGFTEEVVICAAILLHLHLFS